MWTRKGSFSNSIDFFIGSSGYEQQTKTSVQDRTSSLNPKPLSAPPRVETPFHRSRPGESSHPRRVEVSTLVEVQGPHIIGFRAIFWQQEVVPLAAIGRSGAGQRPGARASRRPRLRNGRCFRERGGRWWWENGRMNLGGGNIIRCRKGTY